MTNRTAWVLFVLVMGWLAFVGSGGCRADGEAAAIPAASQPDPAVIQADTEKRMLDAVRDGDMARAQAILSGALDKGLRVGAYHFLKSKLQAAQGDLVGEEDQLRGAINEDPSFAEAYLRLAGILEGRGLWLDAVDLYKRAQELSPQSPQAYLDLGRIYLERKRSASALEILGKAQKACPESAEVALAVADAHEQLGSKAEALREYRAAARIATGDARLRALLKVGDIALALGDPSTSFAYYRDAVAAGAEVTPEAYAKLAKAADGAEWKASEPAWTQLEEYAKGTPTALEREDVYEILSAALGEAREVLAFGDRLAPGPEPKSRHAMRQLQNSLLCEALTAAIAYLDTGDASLLASARVRFADATEARKGLPASGT